MAKAKHTKWIVAWENYRKEQHFVIVYGYKNAKKTAELLVDQPIVFIGKL